jgi:hypothetical protein
MWFEILRDFTDYRDYMGLSLASQLCEWSLSDLISYNLGQFCYTRVWHLTTRTRSLRAREETEEDQRKREALHDVEREEDIEEAMWWLLVCERGGGEEINNTRVSDTRKLNGFALGDDKLGRSMKINS